MKRDGKQSLQEMKEPIEFMQTQIEAKEQGINLKKN